MIVYGTAYFESIKQLLEYQNYVLHREISGGQNYNWHLNIVRFFKCQC
jgi:hypothetical protein